MNEKYKFLKHTADVKFQAYGKNLSETFKNAALALKQVIAEDTGIKVQDKITKKISVKGKDFESLLYNFLEEFLYLLDAEDFLLNKIKNLKINNKSDKEKKEKRLQADIIGDKASKYKFTNDVKAITYNQMFVKKQKIKGKERFICQVVLDV